MARTDMSLLLDFYGSLLTEKQLDCCELYYNEDYSLTEIAELKDISRQGVWDNIRHAEEKLLEYENKTGLVARFEEQRKKYRELKSCILSAESVCGESAAESLKHAESIIDTLLNED